MLLTRIKSTLSLLLLSFLVSISHACSNESAGESIRTSPRASTEDCIEKSSETANLCRRYYKELDLVIAREIQMLEESLQASEQALTKDDSTVLREATYLKGLSRMADEIRPLRVNKEKAFNICINRYEHEIGGCFSSNNISEKAASESVERAVQIVKAEFRGFFDPASTKTGFPRYVWAKTFGGTNNDNGVDVGSSKAKNITILFSCSGNFDINPTTNVQNTSLLQPSNSCVVNLTESGDFRWGFSLENTEPSALHTTYDGKNYVAGSFIGTVDFDPGPEKATRTSVVERWRTGQPSTVDTFIAKYDDNGVFDWVISFGGEGRDSCSSIDLSYDGRFIYATGAIYQKTVDFDPSNNRQIAKTDATTNSTRIPYYAYLAKYDTDGGFLWTKLFANSIGNDVSNLPGGGVALVGVFAEGFDPDPGPETVATEAGFLAGPFAFVSTFNQEGEYSWGHTYGQAGGKSSFTTVSTSREKVVVAGHFSSKNLDLDPGETECIVSSRRVEEDEVLRDQELDAFVVSFLSNGAFGWGSAFGSGSTDNITDSALSKTGDFLVSGIFSGLIDFDPGLNRQERTPAAGNDFFILSLDEQGGFNWVVTSGGENREQIGAIFVDELGSLYSVGGYNGSMDFDFSKSLDRRDSMMSFDAFITRLRL